jgi:hypothetical protein
MNTTTAALDTLLAGIPEAERAQFAPGIRTEAAAITAAESSVAQWLERHFTSTQLGYQHGHTAEHFAEGVVEDIICDLDAEGRFQGLGDTGPEWQSIAMEITARAGVVLADFHRNPEPCELRWIEGCAYPEAAARELARWDVD